MANRRGLSNLELAANPTWVIASTFEECSFCGFLSRDPELGRPSVPCPNCKRSGSPRLIFPGLACITWLEMVGDAYLRATAGADEKKGALVDIIRSDFRPDIDPSWVRIAARKVRRLLRKSPRTETDYHRVLDEIQRRLSLRTREQACRAFSLLANSSDTVNEHSNVVVLTGSLFERLFHDLLVQVLARRGMTNPEAHRTVDKRRRREDLLELFWIATGTRPQEAIGEFGVRGLYEGWQDIADRRNKFLHVSPGVVSAVMAERAFNLAKNAFGLFAFLHNKHCVTVTAGGADSAS
jgi:hypothetical protein